MSVPDGLAIAQASDRRAVHEHVGDGVDLGQALDDATSGFLYGSPVEIAKASAECDQALVAERLIAKQQH